MRPSSCPLRNSLKEERHLKCLRGSNVSFGLQQGQGTGRANFLLIRKFLSKQISDTANGTEITEGANWQEILKNVSSSNKQSLKNGMLSGFGPLIIYNTYPELSEHKQMHLPRQKIYFFITYKPLDPWDPHSHGEAVQIHRRRKTNSSRLL